MTTQPGPWGSPGIIIIHGLCTIVFSSQALITTACLCEPERLKRVAVRLIAPAFPKQTITTRL